MHRVPTVLLLAATLAACGTANGTGGGRPADGDATAGRELFAANCAECHGAELQGTDRGPSFLLDIYAPDHHGDAAFQVAVARGVQPHHWDFGAMPPIEGLTPEQVVDIVAYVRQQQQSAS